MVSVSVSVMVVSYHTLRLPLFKFLFPRPHSLLHRFQTIPRFLLKIFRLLDMLCLKSELE